jgi:hypothetical protein
MRMEVKPLHLNGHQICHGGLFLRWQIPHLHLPATVTTKRQ